MRCCWCDEGTTSERTPPASGHARVLNQHAIERDQDFAGRRRHPSVGVVKCAINPGGHLFAATGGALLFVLQIVRRQDRSREAR
jgi:hypothetical protein